MTDHVTAERRGPNLRLLLNRPKRRNAITVAMYAALADAITAAQDDPDLRVITLEGEGVDFTGGNDLADFMKEIRNRARIPTSLCGGCSARSPPTRSR